MESPKLRCLNLDWLEVYVLGDVNRYPCDAAYYQSHGYVVHQRDYGTRVYADMFTIDDEHGQPFVEVRRHPLSSTMRNGGLFPRESSHIRLSNYACYRGDAISALRDFLALHGYTFVKIFRIDLALDFERFDSGDYPSRFIERFMAGRYSKVNQTNISAHGVDNWNGRVWNSLSWGKPSSMIGTKIYCKSIELQQVKDKPYIRWSWFRAGLIEDPIANTKRNEDGEVYTPAIWRLEFSIKSSAKRVFIIERSDQRHGKIPMPYTLDVFDTPERRWLVFASLCSHYFRFKHYVPDKRKDRCADKQLFVLDLNTQFVKIERYTKSAPVDSRFHRYAAMLAAMQLFVTDDEVKRAIDVLLAYIDTQKLSAMVDATADDVHVKALRLLLRERMNGATSKSVSTRLAELVTLFDDVDTIF